MFRSIEYRLYFFVFLLIGSAVLATFFFIQSFWVYGAFSVFVLIIILFQLYKQYNKFNKNILFLLNALDNGDYSFNFTETKLSKREQELNTMMNRIKEILTRAKKEVIANENFLSLIIESVPTGIIIIDSKNNIRETNNAVHNLLGLPVFTHLNQLKVIDDTFPDLFRELKTGQENKQITIINEREENQISIHVSNIKLKTENLRIVTLNSIGNELEAKEMESWIRLIRVMTHEIMNSIAPITSLTEMLLFSYKTEEEENQEELKENTIYSLQTINSTAKELTTFVESYREFSGVAKPQLASIELCPFLESVMELVAAEMMSRGIKGNVTACDENINIDADRSQINQILVNLVKNAIEAIPENSNGEIKITASYENEKVRIDVANNGKPIPQEILASIFIPFFTTKASGSGIGLSVSRYIMRLHGGNLKHHFVDGWTIFSLTF